MRWLCTLSNSALLIKVAIEFVDRQALMDHPICVLVNVELAAESTQIQMMEYPLSVIKSANFKKLVSMKPDDCKNNFVIRALNEEQNVKAIRQ